MFQCHYQLDRAGKCPYTNACACEEDVALPDKQEKATQTVLMQAEVLSQEWAAVA